MEKKHFFCFASVDNKLECLSLTSIFDLAHYSDVTDGSTQEY